MAITYVGDGGIAVGTTAITPGLPASLQTDDILIGCFRTVNGQAQTIADAAGGTWTEFPDSPQDHTSELRLTVFWSRYNGTQTAPTTNDAGTINLGVIIAFRGVVATGDPFDVTAGDTQSATTSGSIPGDTTTVDECMIVAIAASDRDANSTANASGWTNASLASIDERFDQTVASGVGGGFAIATGIKTTAGTVDATTWTQGASAVLGNLMVALKPLVNTDRRMQMSWAEMEVPTAPRRMQLSFAELEVPNAPRRMQLSWAEMEIPNAFVDRRLQVSWVELETPNGPRRLYVAWAEMEVDNAPRRGQVSWTEMEVPDVPVVGGPTDGSAVHVVRRKRKGG